MRHEGHSLGRQLSPRRSRQDVPCGHQAGRVSGGDWQQVRLLGAGSPTPMLPRVANRIITVGDYTRARRISKCFDGGKAVFEHESHRKFLTLTGTYSGVPITVVAIGMGFSVREGRCPPPCVISLTVPARRSSTFSSASAEPSSMAM